MKRFYPSIRALHLYIGLFISPFVLVFAISVLVFDHSDKLTPAKKHEPATLRLDSVPIRATDMLTARAILDKLSIKGEIDYINKNDSSMRFPVRSPLKMTNIAVNTRSGIVSIQHTEQGALRGTTYLHGMPGPHNVAIRGNSGFIKVWRYLIDVIVYAVLFLTISGVFIWAFFQSERKLGIFSIGLGVIILIGFIILIF